MSPKSHEIIKDNSSTEQTEALCKIMQIRILIKRFRYRLLKFKLAREIEKKMLELFEDPETLEANNTIAKWFYFFDKPILYEHPHKFWIIKDWDYSTHLNFNPTILNDMIWVNKKAVLQKIEEHSDLFKGWNEDNLEEKISELFSNNFDAFSLQIGILLGYPRTECEKYDKYNENRGKICKIIARFSAENPHYIERLIEEFAKNNPTFNKRTLKKKFNEFLRLLQGIPPTKIPKKIRDLIPYRLAPKKLRCNEALFDEMAPFVEFLLENSSIDLSGFDRESVNYFFERRTNGFMCHTNTPEYLAWKADLDAKIDSLEKK